MRGWRRAVGVVVTKPGAHVVEVINFKHPKSMIIWSGTNGIWSRIPSPELASGGRSPPFKENVVVAVVTSNEEESEIHQQFKAGWPRKEQAVQMQAVAAESRLAPAIFPAGRQRVVELQVAESLGTFLDGGKMIAATEISAE